MNLHIISSPARGWCRSSTRIVFSFVVPLVSFGADGYVDGEILIRFREDTATSTRTAFERRERLVFLQEVPTVKVRLYRMLDGIEVLSAVARYTRDPLIEFAEPNFSRQLTGSPDPYYPLQWSLSNIGQAVNGRSGPSGVDIRWPQAMMLFRGTAPVVVAVIDSGVALDHKDILGLNVWLNSREFYGRDGVDDDGNGYLDDMVGWDFYASDRAPLDENGHGTLVASIIAGVSENGIGGRGVCPVAEIMALRVLNQFGRGGAPKFARVSDVALALDYALKNRAKIVNLSIGGTSFSSTEYLMLHALASGGVLVVAAAGNGGYDGIGDNNDSIPIYPASYSVGNIIAVAAQDRSGGLARFSNFGSQSVHIAAPGTEILGADVSRQTFFSTNFDSSTSGWVVGGMPGNRSTQNWGTYTSGSNVIIASNVVGQKYAPFTDTWVASPRINLTGSHGTRLTFEMVFDLADDLLFVEVSPDGFTWLPYDYIYGSSLFGDVVYRREVDLADFDGGSVNVRFRLFSDYSIEGLGVLLDNVSVSGVTVFDPSTPKFRYDDGTSFAAPAVAGVAALVMSQRPDLSVNQVRTIILNSARPMAQLTGKVATGGMVDAEAALRLAGSSSGNSAPGIMRQPDSQTAIAGSSVTFSITVSGTPAPTFQWRKNGVNIPGATNQTLTIGNVAPTDAGSYTCVVSNSVGNATSSAGTLNVNYSRLANLSVRASLAGGQILIVGFATNGGKNVLVRGIGPALGNFGVTGAYPDPRLEFYSPSGALIGANDDWGGTANLSSAFSATGAFTLSANSKDAAALRAVDGPNSAMLKGNGAGIVLVEVYDAGVGYSQRLVNVSARNFVGTGDNVLIAGFVVDCNVPKQLLIRGVGPKLAAFGVPGLLIDPKLDIFNHGGTRVATNDNWSASATETPPLRAAFTATGAFALDEGSKDAALLVRLPAGSYSAVVSGAVSGTGEALVEVYEVP